MPKQRQPQVVDNDDGSISIDLENPPSRKFAGTDADPIDADTGEEIFADLTPRLRTMQVEDDEEEVDEDELEDSEEDESEDDDEVIVADDDEDEEEPEEGASRTSKPSKFRKRLEREQRLRREGDQERAELRARLERLENSQKGTADEAAFNAEKSRIEGELEETRKELEKAFEDGDSKAQRELTEKLTDLKADLREKTNDHKRAQAAARQAPATKSTEPSPIVLTKVKQWIRRHPRFNRDQGFHALVKATDREVAADGFDPESDEFYKEMDKRLKKRYPEEYPKARKRNDPPTVNTRTEASAPSRKAQEDFQIRNGKATLTPRQQANMRKFQMDPNNPADVREYVIQNRRKK